MKNTRGSIIVPEGLKKEMEFLSTAYSSLEKDTGILIKGENMKSSKKNPVIRLYLLKRYDLYWHVEEEIQEFLFTDLLSAYNFLEELPQMSAMDLILKLNQPEKRFSMS